MKKKSGANNRNGRKRPPRMKLSAQESSKRMEDFPNRREAFIAGITKSKAPGDEANVEERPSRMQLTREETLKRMREFSERKEKFIAAIREGKDRVVYP